MATQHGFNLPSSFTEALAFVKKQGKKILGTLEAGKDLIMYHTCLYARHYVGKVKPAISADSLTGKALEYQGLTGKSPRTVQREWIIGEIIMRTKADFIAFVQGGNFSDAHRISGKLYQKVLEGEIEDGNDLEMALREYRTATGKTSNKGKKKASKGTVDAQQKKALELLGVILGKDRMKILAEILGYSVEDGYAEFWSLLNLMLDEPSDYFKKTTTSTPSKQKTG